MSAHVTHDADCWHDHHECAVAKIGRLRVQLDERYRALVKVKQRAAALEDVVRRQNVRNKEQRTKTYNARRAVMGANYAGLTFEHQNRLLTASVALLLAERARRQRRKGRG